MAQGGGREDESGFVDVTEMQRVRHPEGGAVSGGIREVQKTRWMVQVVPLCETKEPDPHRVWVG